MRTRAASDIGIDRFALVGLDRNDNARPSQKHQSLIGAEPLRREGQQRYLTSRTADFIASVGIQE